MKVLFVCQRNNGRSQMAEGLYNSLTETRNAESAGTEVDKDGQLLEERAAEPGSEVGRVIETMAEIGVDVRRSSRTLLSPSTLDAYDRVVVIMKPETIPGHLKAHQKVEVWEMEDPKVKDTAGVRETRDEIKERVINLIKSETKP